MNSSTNDVADDDTKSSEDKEEHQRLVLSSEDLKTQRSIGKLVFYESQRLGDGCDGTSVFR